MLSGVLLKNTLPHRGYALLVDKVELNEDGLTATGYYCIIAENNPILQGHFPGNPVFRGVDVIEIANLTAACLAKPKLKEGFALPILRGLDGIKLRGTAKPGDTLVAKVKLLQEKNGLIFTFSAEITNNRGEKIAQIGKITGVAVSQDQIGA